MVTLDQIQNALAVIYEACQQHGGGGSREHTSQSLNIKNADGIPLTQARQYIYTMSFQDYAREQIVSVSIVVTSK